MLYLIYRRVEGNIKILNFTFNLNKQIKYISISKYSMLLVTLH